MCLFFLIVVKLSSLAYIRLKKYFISTPIFFIEELSIYVPGRVALRSHYIKKASAAKKAEVPGRSQEPLSQRGCERLNLTSSGCIRFSHNIVMHKRSFYGPLEVSFGEMEYLWRSLTTRRSRRPGDKHEEDSKTTRSLPFGRFLYARCNQTIGQQKHTSTYWHP